MPCGQPSLSFPLPFTMSAGAPSGAERPCRACSRPRACQQGCGRTGPPAGEAAGRLLERAALPCGPGWELRLTPCCAGLSLFAPLVMSLWRPLDSWRRCGGCTTPPGDGASVRSRASSPRCASSRRVRVVDMVSPGAQLGSRCLCPVALCLPLKTCSPTPCTLTLQKQDEELTAWQQLQEAEAAATSLHGKAAAAGGAAAATDAV